MLAALQHHRCGSGFIGFHCLTLCQMGTLQLMRHATPTVSACILLVATRRKGYDLRGYNKEGYHFKGYHKEGYGE